MLNMSSCRTIAGHQPTFFILKWFCFLSPKPPLSTNSPTKYFRKSKQVQLSIRHVYRISINSQQFVEIIHELRVFVEDVSTSDRIFFDQVFIIVRSHLLYHLLWIFLLRVLFCCSFTIFLLLFLTLPHLCFCFTF